MVFSGYKSYLLRLNKLFSTPLAPWQLTVACAFILTVFYNKPAMSSVTSLDSTGLFFAILFMLFLINLFICQLFSVRYLQKIWLVFLIAIGAVGQYFMLQYGVVLDKTMLVNVIETDVREATGLLNVGMIKYFLLYLIFPMIIIVFLKIKPLSFKLFLKGYVVTLAGSLVMLSLLLFSQYQSYAGVFREHRYLKHQALPLSVISATTSIMHTESADSEPFQVYATDAKLIQSSSVKPKLVIMVLGETVRADHLGINGYSRNTTPKLSSRDLINFGAVEACGTTTAVSVPCLFSYLQRSEFDDNKAKNSDNLLDVLQRAGIKVIWRDNNSGCKGMCNRVEQDPLFAENSDFSCKAGECPDIAMLHALPQTITTHSTPQQNVLVVLHQLGNHGPEYYKRSLPEQKVFMPECQTNLLGECEQEHIINAYDNAIVATDSLLDDTIEMLMDLNEQYDTALLYLSDHGESLGENGVYLHGLPYWMAPEAQTRVPMLLWLSDGFKQRAEFDVGCLSRSEHVSHDNIFASMLSLFSVQTEAKQAPLDLIGLCS
ncbi:phosphoethanolamine transferase [Nitrincola iocasae]|uniref:Phosphoethanolamine--lipid A transferase n=1 Tax=Nitrincola iocasae TaxID=2614693 RepID=A0A5J6LHQ2_9GAMM|nr:phosphoethanolamine--lipid A transferase [Nitrincola iocasae]QEW07913.1 phosphoethanolamine--lipid A transferase [Nitrincola iocasae]